MLDPLEPTDPPVVKTIKREPAVIISAVVAVLTFVLANFLDLTALLASFGLIIAPETGALIQNLINLILVVLGGIVIRQQVTPLADPKDADGAPLEAVYNYGERGQEYPEY